MSKFTSVTEKFQYYLKKHNEIYICNQLKFNIRKKNRKIRICNRLKSNILNRNVAKFTRELFKDSAVGRTIAKFAFIIDWVYKLKKKKIVAKFKSETD